MGHQPIEALLDKYFEGKTNLPEEAQLKQYFEEEEVAEHLLPYQPLFSYLEAAATPMLDDRFDEQLLARIAPEETKKPAVIRRMTPYTWVVRVAAVALLTLGGWWVANQYTGTSEQTAGIDWSKYEVQNPEEAFKYTQMALLKASDELNRGANTAAREVRNIGKLGKYLEE
jgi:hypothetical protein